MSLIVTDSGGGGDFVPISEGTHIARCVRVIDLGMQPGSAEYPDPKHKVLLGWEVPGEVVVIDDVDMPALVQSRYTASLHPKAKLRADLESWRGRAFTAGELKGFELRGVLDAPCMITVVHSPDGRYANVRAISKLPQGFTAPARISDLIYYAQEDGKNRTYLGLTDKMRALIDQGREASGTLPPPRQPVQPPHPQRPGAQVVPPLAQQQPAPVLVTPPPFEALDDDLVPF